MGLYDVFIPGELLHTYFQGVRKAFWLLQIHLYVHIFDYEMAQDIDLRLAPYPLWDPIVLPPAYWELKDCLRAR